MTDPLGGQSATDANGQSAGAGEGSGSAGETGQGAGAAAGGTGNAGTETGGQSAATITQAEYDALKARMQAADQRAGKAETDLKQIRDKDMPALEKLTRDLNETQAQVTALTGERDALRLENAFLTDNSHEWQNPATALKLLDRSKVTIDSDGKIIGLKDALAALAKTDAYLLKPKAADDGSGAPTAPQHLGTPPATGGQQGQGTSRAEMLRRIPAMRTRLGN